MMLSPWTRRGSPAVGSKKNLPPPGSLTTPAFFRPAKYARKDLGGRVMQKRRVVSRVRDVRIWKGQRAVLGSSWLVFAYEFPACRSENGGGGGGGRGGRGRRGGRDSDESAVGNETGMWW